MIDAHPRDKRFDELLVLCNNDITVPEGDRECMSRAKVLWIDAYTLHFWSNCFRGGCLQSFFRCLLTTVIRRRTGWLLIQWREDKDDPTKFWVSNFDPTATVRQLVYWAKLRWWVEQNYQQMKTHLGLDHFEGRSWTGWHHPGYTHHDCVQLSGA